MKLVGAHIGKYVVTEELGSGSFGKVCRAVDTCLASEKTIKVLEMDEPSDYLKLINEAQIQDKCRHKNIISINEANVYQFAGKLHLVIDIEHADGGSVEKIMEKGWLSIRRSIDIVNEALFGLFHAHTHGFLHRDIKPANILIANNCVKLSDFGLACYTPTGFIGIGSQAYVTHLPPECFNSGITSYLTDIYAMGVTLFRFVNNDTDWSSKVFSLPKYDEILKKGHVLKKIPFEEYVPEQVRRIVLKACNADPSKRYQSAQGMQQALNKLKFGKEWIFKGYFYWLAKDGDDSYKMELVSNKKGFNVVYTKNDRRVNDKCKTFSAESDAICYMKEIVRNESLL